MSDGDFSGLERRGGSSLARQRRQLFRVLQWVEHLDGSGVATLSSDRGPAGDLLVSRGRLCLAVPAAGDLGHDQLGEDLTQAVGRARVAGRFSETLASWAGEPLLAVRRELLHLTAANLLEVVGSADESGLHVALRPARDDYDQRLAFSASETFVACLGRLLAASMAAAAPLLGAIDCPTFLVLARSGEAGEMPYPVAARGLEAATLADLLHLGRWTFELCGNVSEVVPGDSLQIVTVREEDWVWHFVGGAASMVALRTNRTRAEVSLTRALGVAGAGRL